jgi:hypothetical protein
MTEKTELPLGSKLEPSPLDAYVSAEPNEPVFTLQGGDVLGAPLVIMWARLARALCGLGFEPIATYDWLDSIVKNHQVEKDEDKENLLRRATEAEQVAWAMGNYRKGHNVEAADAQPVLVELKLDLHDYRIYCANRLSNAFSEMNDMIEQLDKLGLEDEDVIPSIKNEIVALRMLFNKVEPRPGRKLDNVWKW